MSIFFIAQTPRAGEENHCIVVPRSLPISEREVFHRINTAVYQAEGKDYLAVSRVVEQTNSKRQGREMLVLVGLDVNRLTNQQRDEVRAKLEHYFSQFEVLITKCIDWKGENGTSLKQRPELEKWANDPLFHRLPRISLQIHYKEEKNFSWRTRCKVLTIVLVIGVVATIVSFGKYAKWDNNETKIAKTAVEKVIEVWYQQGFVIAQQNLDKAREELEILFCGKSVKNSNDFSQCDKLSDNNVHELTTRWVKDEVSRHFLINQLNLDEIDSLAKRVEIRNQLRKLNAVLANIVPTEVYIPLFNQEDVTIAQKIKDILSQLLQEDQKLAHYLQEEANLKQKFRFHSLLTVWQQQQVFSSEHRHYANDELIALLSSTCNQSMECQTEKLEKYNQAQSIPDLLEMRKEEKQFLLEELSFHNMIKPPPLNTIVAIRNALRELHAKLDDDNNPKRVFLPLFNQEDIVIVSELNQEFELTENPRNLLEGLRNKLKRKPYRFLKNQMKNLVEQVDKMKKK